MAQETAFAVKGLALFVVTTTKLMRGSAKNVAQSRHTIWFLGSQSVWIQVDRGAKAAQPRNITYLHK